MGLNIRDIVPKREIQFSDLNGKVIAVDAFNAIYQFLSSIRQYDGTPLKDSKGKITSHLSGIFYRNINLLDEGIKLIYVFDGKPPELKMKTREIRTDAKKIAEERYNEAKEKEDTEMMKKYSQQLSYMSDEIIQESKELLDALGIPVVEAPSEGEAQASHLVKRGQAYAIASQDYDSLIFGAPRLIQNLTLSRKRKTVSGVVEIYPQIIELEKVLNYLQIDYEQLISLGILTGTDYNPGGIRGIGQKKALDIVRKYKTPYAIFEQFKEADFNWTEIFSLFKKPEVRDFEIEFPKINKDKIKSILMEHDFSEERIDKYTEKLERIKKESAQKKLF
jgi:flap endonuclease-1